MTRPVDALRPPSWAPAIALVSITLLGFAVRLFRAGTQSLWVDEIETAKIATRPLGDLVRGVGVDVMPSAWLSPFYYAVLKGIVLLPLPSSERLLRLSSVVLPALRLPEWTVTFVVVFLLVGFPVAMVMAWVFDVGPASRSDVTSRRTEGTGLASTQSTASLYPPPPPAPATVSFTYTVPAAVTVTVPRLTVAYE